MILPPYVQNAVGIVNLYSATGKVPGKLASAFDSNMPVKIWTHFDEWPRHCDYYCTQTALCKEVVFAAGRMMAMPIVIDEGNGWLHSKIKQRRANGQETWIFVARRKGDDGK